MKIQDEEFGPVQWESFKQSLIMVGAIFLSTLFAVAFSEGVQKATLLVQNSVIW